MKAAIVILSLAAMAISPAQEPLNRERPGRFHLKAEGPWLGVNLARVEASTAAQLRDVPKGFGLLIESVEDGSPAEKSGLLPMDVLWKLGDQLIANKPQLHSLLRMKGTGTVIELSVFRAGETLPVSVVIGTRPPCDQEAHLAAKEILLPVSQLPLMGIKYNSRSGFIEDGDLVVSLTRKTQGYEYIITKGEAEISQGKLEGESVTSWPATLDEDARGKILALMQSIQRAEAGEGPSPRAPRVRRVPSPRVNPNANSAK